MVRNIVYWVVSVASLGLLFLEAPAGGLLTTTADRGKVTKNAQGRTVRGSGPVFVWLGGGYQGGK